MLLCKVVSELKYCVNIFQVHQLYVCVYIELHMVRLTDRETSGL